MGEGHSQVVDEVCGVPMEEEHSRSVADEMSGWAAMEEGHGWAAADKKSGWAAMEEGHGWAAADEKSGWAAMEEEGSWTAVDKGCRQAAMGETAGRDTPLGKVGPKVDIELSASGLQPGTVKRPISGGNPSIPG
jgi:hypothetical protein